MRITKKVQIQLQDATIKINDCIRRAQVLNRINSSANTRVKGGLSIVINELGEYYVMLLDRQFARICGVHHATISDRGGILAIKNAWLKQDITRISGGKNPNLNHIALRTKHYYYETHKDHRTVDILLSLEDYKSFIKILSPFIKYINTNHTGDFLYKIFQWLQFWQAGNYELNYEHYWLRLSNIMNEYSIGEKVPNSYDNFWQNLADISREK